jgi:TM2 domain-containing membrane protein YozV
MPFPDRHIGRDEQEGSVSYRSEPYVPDARAMMRYDANRKSALVAYVLWFFLGYFGVHRFYLGRVGSGLAMLLLGLLSGALTVVLIGYIGLAIIAIWWLIDAVLIPGMTRRYNNRLVDEIAR